MENLLPEPLFTLISQSLLPTSSKLVASPSRFFPSINQPRNPPLNPYSQKMAQYLEAHKADADFRALDQKVTLLLTKNKEQAGKNESIEKKIRALEKRNEELEVRLKASEHNALARHLNALLLPHSHTPLHPLHSIHTNAPLKNFPKHASDIRTMSSLEVATLLKELDADVTKVVSAGERKSRLKDVIGVGEKGSVVEVVGAGGGKGMADGVDGIESGEKGEKGEKKGPMQLPGKATGPPPGKVLPIQRRD